MKAIKQSVLGQPSWRLVSDLVEAFVTETGGQLGPVTFDRHRRRWQPFSVAPWAQEATDPGMPPILKALRGDFLCLPFGGNATPFRKERHPVHGETANATWKLEAYGEVAGSAQLHLSLTTRVRKGRVDKFIKLVQGHNAVYCQDVISGMRGPMCLGHHAMIKFPDRPGSGVFSTSPFLYGQVYPQPTERPENRGYSILKPGARFTTLDSVPMVTGEQANLSRYPARRGYEDIAMLVSDTDVPFAWNAVAFAREHFAWFALKDPRVLRNTVLWHSNGGRHYPPWNGRHVNVLGIEDVTANFHEGLAESANLNDISNIGYPTSLELRPDRPLRINYIMGVAPLPPGFDRVATIQADAQRESILLTSDNGKSARVPLDAGFLRTEELSAPGSSAA